MRTTGSKRERAQMEKNESCCSSRDPHTSDIRDLPEDTIQTRQYHIENSHCGVSTKTTSPKPPCPEGDKGIEAFPVFLADLSLCSAPTIREDIWILIIGFNRGNYYYDQEILSPLRP